MRSAKQIVFRYGSLAEATIKDEEVDFVFEEANSNEGSTVAENPLIGKEQARKYARSQNCRFVILSNGNLHYFWDLERGNPYVITSFPTPDLVVGYQKVSPDPQRLIEERVGDDYIVLTQRPDYQSEAAWRNEAERAGYIQANKLRFLRPYQLKAIYALGRTRGASDDHPGRGADHGADLGAGNR
jgi:type I restriction enzyme R subunit